MSALRWSMPPGVSGRVRMNSSSRGSTFSSTVHRDHVVLEHVPDAGLGTPRMAAGGVHVTDGLDRHGRARGTDHEHVPLTAVLPGHVHHGHSMPSCTAMGDVSLAHGTVEIWMVSGRTRRMSTT